MQRARRLEEVIAELRQPAATGQPAATAAAAAAHGGDCGGGGGDGGGGDGDGGGGDGGGGGGKGGVEHNPPRLYGASASPLPDSSAASVSSSPVSSSVSAIGDARGADTLRRELIEGETSDGRAREGSQHVGQNAQRKLSAAATSDLQRLQLVSAAGARLMPNTEEEMRASLEAHWRRLLLHRDGEQRK